MVYLPVGEKYKNILKNGLIIPDNLFDGEKVRDFNFSKVV
jgi:hypothetical protein